MHLAEYLSSIQTLFSSQPTFESPAVSLDPNSSYVALIPCLSRLFSTAVRSKFFVTFSSILRGIPSLQSSSSRYQGALDLYFLATTFS